MFVKGDHITISSNGKTYVGKVLRMPNDYSVELGQFVVIKLDKAVGQQKTYCTRVNGTAKPFGFDCATATLV